MILSHQEILEACVEWASKHHGLKLSGNMDVRVKLRDNQNMPSRVPNMIYLVETMNIEFSESQGLQPYRDPETK